MGLIVNKIHQVMSFHQEPFIQPYIKLNSEKRRDAKAAFEKDFYKLLNNALFGKFLQNLKKTD
jgi:hypothetical protein